MTRPRIALVCSSLEEGRDGVGDYCRRLANALHALGVDCALLALNDRWIDQNMTGSSADTGPLLRLAQRSTRQEKFEAASGFLSDFNPDWISFQFVSYGLNAKGIVFAETGWLSRLFSPYRLELMCHEIWVGSEINPTIKNRLVGLIQRQAIQWLIARLKPAVVHTTNVRYAAFYKSIGIETKLLPLFGNIPVTTTDGYGRMSSALREQGLSEDDRSRYWLFGIFGGIVARWPFENIFNRIADIAQRANRIPVIVAFGAIGAEPESIAAEWRKRCPALKFVWLGRQPGAAISEIMNTLDFAISSHEHYAIGKSGSAAALLEHGVPVITNWGYDRNFPTVVEPPLDQLVWHDDDMLEQRLLNPPVRTRVPDRASQIARHLLDDLQKATSARA